ncbi:MAG: Na+/H+ antiporter subunit E [bacterium]|nr:Na+/H+ antiporter subunit E [bacterium]
MKRAIVLFAALYGTWLLLSGHYTATLMIYGALSCAAVVAIVMHLGIVDDEAVPTQLGPGHVFYLPWLAKEIVLSNLSVARVILSPSLPIRPRILQVEASQASDVAQVIYANSITLTPGTVTLDVRDGKLLVHALTSDSAEGLLSGEMDRRVAALEGATARETAAGSDA